MVVTNPSSSRPRTSFAHELVLALSKPKTKKEPRTGIQKNSAKSNPHDWINFLKKRKDNLNAEDVDDKSDSHRVKVLEKTLKDTKGALDKEKEAHADTKKRYDNDKRVEEIRKNLTQEKKKNKELLAELNSYKIVQDEVEKKLKTSAKVCRSQHTEKIEQLQKEKDEIKKIYEAKTLEINSMLAELKVTLKKKDFENELLKGDLEKKDKIIRDLRTKVAEKKDSDEKPDRGIIQDSTLATLCSPSRKKRKNVLKEDFLSKKKPRRASNSEDVRTLGNITNNIVQKEEHEIIFLDETIEEEEAVTNFVTPADSVKLILDEMLDFDYSSGEGEVADGTHDSSFGVDQTDSIVFIVDLLASLLDSF